MDSTYYDLAIIGAGLIGSAAARYASIYPIKLCVIGPEEPKVICIFSQHLYIILMKSKVKQKSRLTFSVVSIIYVG